MNALALSNLDSLVQPVVAWLLTYALHSTLLLGAAWGGTRHLRRRRLATQELLWKAALVGGLVTASLQLATGWQPLGWELTSATPAMVNASAMESATQESTVTPVAPPATSGNPATSTSHPSPDSAVILARIPTAHPATEASPPWALGMVSLWLLGAAVLIASLLFSYRHLCHRLRRRAEVVGGTLRRLFDRLRPERVVGRPVRLSSSSRIQSPLAKGWRQPEVCVPVRVLSELPEDQQQSLLAHELGHLARHDPAWLLLCRAVESVFFFQPLNRLARRRLQEIAELRADDWAVAATGRPLELARCLTRVAGWNLETLPVPAMAHRGGGLTQRIHRLLSDQRDSEGWHRGLLATVAAVLLAVALIAPGVAATAPEAPPAPEAPEAPEVPAPSEAPEAPETPPVAEPGEAPEPPEAPTVEALPAPESPANRGWTAPRIAPVPAAPQPPRGPAAGTRRAFPAPRVLPRPPAVAPRPGASLPLIRALADRPFRIAAASPSPAPGSERPQRHQEAHEEHQEHRHEVHEEHRHEHEMEHEWRAEVAEAIARELERNQELLEAALAPLEGDLRREMDQVTRELDLALAPVLKNLEGEMAGVARLAEELHVTIPHEALASLGEDIAAATANIRAHLHPMRDAQFQAELRAVLESSQPDPEALHKLTEEARRLAARNRRSPEELEALKTRARDLAERSRPDPEQLERLREQARRLAEEVRIPREELRQMRERIDREVRLRLEEVRRQLEAQRSQLRQQREQLERRNRDLERRNRDLERQNRDLERQNEDSSP